MGYYENFYFQTHDSFSAEQTLTFAAGIVAWRERPL
jgi:hypothetical protein